MRKILPIIAFSLVFGLTYSQNQYSDAELNEMFKTYSYYIAQYIAYEEIIAKYPSLKVEATKAQTLWNISFKSSVDHIYTELKSNLGEKFDELEEKIISQGLSQTDFSKFTYEEAQIFIEEIKSRAKGNIPSPFIETLLIFNPKYQSNPDREMTDGFEKKYSTKESNKSNEINVILRYPNSWKASNGDRPNIVQKFESRNGHGFESALIRIQKSKENLIDNDHKLFLSEEGLKYQLPDESKILEIKTGLKMDGCPASCITFYKVQEQMNFKIKMISESYFLSYNNYQIMLMFSVGSITDNYDELFSNYLRNKKLFFKMV